MCPEPQDGQKNYFYGDDQFELTFHNKHKDKVMDSYLPYVIAQANAIKEEEKVVKLYTNHETYDYGSSNDNSSHVWWSINLEHPATFETLVTHPEMKRTIVDDLDRFLEKMLLVIWSTWYWQV